MKLTLYKKCILNNSYSEVFNCKKSTEKNGQMMSVLDAYLSDLDKFEYEDDFIYTEGNGSFQIELYPLQNGDDIYSYNYLKIEEEENGKTIFKRYCFIDNINKIASNVVNVQYSEDIWSSYSGSMEIRDGVICNKYRNPKVPYFLPVPYDGNNKPLYKDLLGFGEQGFIIVCQLQVYKLQADGVPNKRLTYTVTMATSDRYEPTGKSYTPTKFENARILNELVRAMAEDNFRRWSGNRTELAEYYYYEIDNFTLIPATNDFLKRLGQIPSIGCVTVSLYDDSEDPTATKTVVNFLDLNARSEGYYGIPVFSGRIENDFKIMSFGTILSTYEVTPNGGDIEYAIYMYPTEYDLKLILEIQNKIIDITNDLVVKMPFTSLNGEENTAKKIQREMANIKGTFSIVEGVAETGIQVAGAVMTGGVSLLGGSTVETLQNGAVNYASKYSKRISSWTRASMTTKQEQASVGGIVGGVMKIANGVTDLVYANKPKYSSTQGTFATSEGLMNAIWEFGTYSIVPDNEEYVNALLKRIGYTVFMTVTSYDEVFDSTEQYDVVKMQTAVVYGNFQQEITYALTEILLTGVRVFNSYNVNINN